MAIEAKRAAKLEKKLKTLLGGYQVSLTFYRFEFQDNFDYLF